MVPRLISFLKLEPPRFKGTISEDPQDFIFTLEHYFDALNSTDELKGSDIQHSF